jgi:hypothetical protein
MTFPYKLGRKSAQHNLRIPLLSRYTTALPSAPLGCNWDIFCSFQMFGNDRLGDCTAAALANQEITWNAACGKAITFTDNQVVQFYSATTGYNPADPSTDQGGVESTVLTQWLKTPGLLGGHNLTAFAAFRPQNLDSLKDSIWITGGAYLGINLPKTIEEQGTLWQVPAQGPTGLGAPGSLGGHAVCAIGYDTRVIYFASWGALYRMTWDFYTTYTEEAYSLVSADFIKNGLSPSGFDLITLQADMQALAA